MMKRGHTRGRLSLSGQQSYQPFQFHMLPSGKTFHYKMYKECFFLSMVTLLEIQLSHHTWFYDLHTGIFSVFQLHKIPKEMEVNK